MRQNFTRLNLDISQFSNYPLVRMLLIRKYPIWHDVLQHKFIPTKYHIFSAMIVSFSIFSHYYTKQTLKTTQFRSPCTTSGNRTGPTLTTRACKQHEEQYITRSVYYKISYSVYINTTSWVIHWGQTSVMDCRCGGVLPGIMSLIHNDISWSVSLCVVWSRCSASRNANTSRCSVDRKVDTCE